MDIMYKSRTIYLPWGYILLSKNKGFGLCLGFWFNRKSMQFNMELFNIRFYLHLEKSYA